MKEGGLGGPRLSRALPIWPREGRHCRRSRPKTWGLSSTL
jgi:hypothetical protein